MPRALLLPLVAIGLIALEFLLQRLLEPLPGPPVVLALLVVVAVELPHLLRSFVREVVLLSLLGGLVLELGSALPPGLILPVVLAVSLTAALASRRLFSHVHVPVVAGAVFLGVLVTRLLLVLIAQRELLVGASPLLVLGGLWRFLVLPALLSIPVGLAWRWLFIRYRTPLFSQLFGWSETRL